MKSHLHLGDLEEMRAVLMILRDHREPRAFAPRSPSTQSLETEFYSHDGHLKTLRMLKTYQNSILNTLSPGINLTFPTFHFIRVFHTQYSVTPWEGTAWEI